MTIASGTCGETATWRLEDDGILYVEGTGEMEDYTSSTGQPWYSYLSQITGVVIGEGITHIGQGAFYQHTAITSLTLASTVTSIGNTVNDYGSFYYCTGLVMGLLDLSNVTSIGKYAFLNCKLIESVKLGDVQTLGNGAFADCIGLTSIDFGNVSSIEATCFSSCTGLTELSFPDSLISIGDSAFISCSYITSINFNKVQTIKSTAFYNCSRLKNVDFGDVTTIGDSAFYNCTSLVDIDLKNIQTIGVNVFYGCNALESIIFGKDLTSIGNSAFQRLRYYSSSSSFVKRTFKFLGPKPTFGTNAVGYYAYRDSSNNTTYKTDGSDAYTTGFVYDSSVDNGKFYASSFYPIGFGDYITYTIDGDSLMLSGSGEMYTFTSVFKLPPDMASCTKLYIGPDITINSSVMTLFKRTLVLLSIPYMTTIDDSMFASFSNLESIDISGAVIIGASAFSSCSKLKEVNMPNVRTIGASAFSGCPLKKIILPDTVNSIGATAFQYHRHHGIIVPASVTSIGANAFTPATNAYRKHMTIVFRGTYISGTYTAPTGMMIHEFCKNEAENDNSADYAAGTVNSSHPVMIRTEGGWRVISTDMIDNT